MCYNRPKGKLKGRAACYLTAERGMTKKGKMIFRYSSLLRITKGFCLERVAGNWPIFKKGMRRC